MAGSQRVRKDILDLDDEEKDRLIRAFLALQKAPEAGVDRYFEIASLHGQPFRGPGYGNSAWWGGYCHHGNVLFLTWHRAYILYFENALQEIDKDVTLPYWNQMRDDDTGAVVPKIFTDKEYTFKTGPDKDKAVKNPLYSYRLTKGFADKVSRPDVDYGKPKGYETVRYPFSGLVGPNDIRKANIHNKRTKKFTDVQITQYLNDNLRDWLNGRERVPGMRAKYRECLETKAYTVFSNKTSAAKWNDDHADTSNLVVSLETPHDAIHNAIGGQDMPDNLIFDGSSGDMGQSDTASFDPIFYFHHCFMDKVFWAWQEKHADGIPSGVDGVTIDEGYPGTSPVDHQGPTPGLAPESWLSMQTPLHPFKEGDKFWTSEVIAKRSDLPYKYDNLDISLPKCPAGGTPLCPPNLETKPERFVRISGIDRSSIAGSFVVSAWAKVPGTVDEVFVGCEPVFSRWNVSGCANCNNHLRVTAHIPLCHFDEDFVKKANFSSTCTVGTREVGGGELSRAMLSLTV
jgi:tyrosinase